MYHPMRDRVFAGLLMNKGLCESVIYAVTGLTFTVQDVRPQYCEFGELDQGRVIILDIKAVDPNGVACNLEVQVKYYPGGTHENRVVFHACRLLSKQLRRGEGFDKVRPVSVIFFNFESTSEDFIRHITLRDDKGSLYSNLMQMYEINTMENSKAKAQHNFVKIFSIFLLYACEQEKFYSKLAAEGISNDHEIVMMLMQYYDILTKNEKVKEELKIMEMTSDDKIFLVTRNYADILEKGMEKGKEIGVGTVLSVMRDLSEHKPINEIAALYNISIQKVEEIQAAAMKLNSA